MERTDVRHADNAPTRPPLLVHDLTRASTLTCGGHLEHPDNEPCRKARKEGEPADCVEIDDMLLKVAAVVNRLRGFEKCEL